MSDTVPIVFSHPHDGYAPGERVEVPIDEARSLVDRAYAQYATITAAKAAGGSRDDAITAK